MPTIILLQARDQVKKNFMYYWKTLKLYQTAIKSKIPVPSGYFVSGGLSDNGF